MADLQKINRKIQNRSESNGRIMQTETQSKGNSARASKYGLGLIQARLKKTSETVIALQFLIMNIEKILRDSFLPIFQNWLQDMLSGLQYGLAYKFA
ncbi:hypothetical protein H4683_003948 [Filibacter limicola]|uniref:Transposase DDE domain-containing protein n=1 Tax=Sporosarcina limicola TaxID=34101 RepID=A0A927MPD3_9BACL|nr:hypothetical protein [Sporosarcina limicola]